MASSGRSTDTAAGRRRAAAARLLALALAATVAHPARADIVIGIGTSISGAAAWEGEQHLRGVEAAVADVNAGGGVLGEPLRLLIGDDACDEVQAVAVADQLVTGGAAFVSGHVCSHASIAASVMYDRADVIMISPASTNPQLTELGRPTVFRVVGRDDGQGRVAGGYLAAHWPEGRIAVIHDGTLFGEGLARETRNNLARHGVDPVVYRRLPEEHVEFRDFAAGLVEARPDAIYIAGYIREVALIVRELRAQGSTAQILGSELVGDEFWLIAGEAGEGTIFTFSPDPRNQPHAAGLVDRFRRDGFEPAGFTLQAYATVEVWAQAVEAAGTLEPDRVVEALHAGSFETAIGRIGFDDKGDVTGIEVHTWYVWRDGRYRPLE